MDKKPSTVSIVPADSEPRINKKQQDKRMLTDTVASCQLMLENGGGLFHFKLIQDSTSVTVGRAQQPDETESINLSSFNGFELGVSRIHARFERAGSRVFLRDLGSTNGTWVNGERLVPNHVFEVSHGDRIEFGRLPAQLYIK